MSPAASLSHPLPPRSLFPTGVSPATANGIYPGAGGSDTNTSCNVLPPSLKNPANLRQNFPVLTNAQAGSATTTVSGTLNSAANKTFLVQFYATAVPEPSGNIEGKTYLGDAYVATDVNCNGAVTA